MKGSPSQLLPAFVRARLERRDTLRGAFDNSFWLFADQILRMAAGLLIGTWTARYLGPEKYGWLSYVFAVTGMVGSFTSLGINAVVVRELVRQPDEAEGWLGTAFFLRTAGAAAGFLICVAIAANLTLPTSALVLIAAAVFLLQVPDVADLWFQARGDSRMSAWVRMSVCVAGSALRLGLLLARAPLFAFVIATVVETALAAAGWWWAARRQGGAMSRWRCEWPRLGGLLRESWPLAISGLAVSAQAYADQLIMGALIGPEELGQYAAALRLVSVFAFVPMVIHTAAAPEITRAKQVDETLYRRRLHGLYRLMTGAFLLTTAALILVGPPVARLLYGPAFAGATLLLPWLALRLYFTNFGVARSIFINNAGLFRFALWTSLVGAAVNLGLNLVLVPRWGARGAIGASLVSFAVTTFAFDAFDPQARINLRLMGRATFLPWRRFAA